MSLFRIYVVTLLPQPKEPGVHGTIEGLSPGSPQVSQATAIYRARFRPSIFLPIETRSCRRAIHQDLQLTSKEACQINWCPNIPQQLFFSRWLSKIRAVSRTWTSSTAFRLTFRQQRTKISFKRIIRNRFKVKGNIHRTRQDYQVDQRNKIGRRWIYKRYKLGLARLLLKICSHQCNQITLKCVKNLISLKNWR